MGVLQWPQILVLGIELPVILNGAIAHIDAQITTCQMCNIFPGLLASISSTHLEIESSDEFNLEMI